MKKVIQFLPAMAILLASGLAVATTSKSVSGSWAPVPTSVDPSGWVNIHNLPEGYIGYRCEDSLNQCLFNSPNFGDPAAEKGDFELIPE